MSDCSYSYNDYIIKEVETIETNKLIDTVKINKIQCCSIIRNIL